MEQDSFVIADNACIRLDRIDYVVILKDQYLIHTGNASFASEEPDRGLDDFLRRSPRIFHDGTNIINLERVAALYVDRFDIMYYFGSGDRLKVHCTGLQNLVDYLELAYGFCDAARLHVLRRYLSNKLTETLSWGFE